MADVIKYRFRPRRRTAANWTALNEVLLNAELGVETAPDPADFKFKIGDGVTAWNDLPYFAAGIKELVEGDGINVDVTDPTRPVISNIGVLDITAGANISINKLNPRNPIISSTLGIVNLKTRVDAYTDLPSSGNADGDAILVDGPPQQIYVWDGSSWPDEGKGFSPGGGMSVPNYVDTVMLDAPIAFWKLDDVSGTSAIDSSGNVRHGVYTGGYDLGLVPTINLPGAVMLNGTNGFVDIAYGSWMNASDVTVECWAYVNANPTARVGYMTRKFGTVGNIPYSLETAADSGNTPQMAQYNGSTWSSAKSQATMPLLGWVHLVGTRTSTGVLNIYMNGIKANVSTTATPSLTSTEGLFLGRQHNYITSSLYLAGALSCCAVYDKVLTPKQVADHYNVGSVPRWLIGD